MDLQGIDLKDIDLVVQWKVTCDPCMLWQRFGRGARDKGIQATALLFIELKDLDPVGPPVEGRKRKASEKDDKKGVQSKRAKKEKPTPSILDPDKVEEDDFWAARKEVYHEPISDKKEPEINQVLDDVINAEGRGIHCRRKPFMVYFGDDECSGSYILFSRSALNNVLQGFVNVTTPSTGLVLVVHHNHLVSVAISVIRTSLKICFDSLTQYRKPSYADRR